MHREQGVTLFEQLISLAILAIFTALAAPSVSHLFQQPRAELALITLKHQLKYARVKAIATGETVTLCPLLNNRCSSDDWHQQLTLFIDTKPLGTFSKGDRKLQVIDAIIKTDQLTYSRSAVSFKHTGGLAGLYNGTFIYCPNVQKRQPGVAMSVSFSGRARFKATNQCEK
ncbi:GspH/FimT family pseudopilin [Pseudoalteromonas sp. T1lg65]|uniref:GspH/FimT family pseudopilin n=1 Tax=Pseudoalteromonas sp. T1lg65 TaxID=2077101 RepID=UPI003F799ACE